MSSVVFISPAVCREHDPGPGHPERPARLDAIQQRLQADGLLDEMRLVPARKATPQEIEAVHKADHVAMVTRLIESGAHILDGDTAVCPRSLEAAYLSAGAALTGVDLLRDGEATRVFCGVRPPGHHAETQRSMGFCVFNNVAAAAAYARSSGLADRVLIIDWDVHHGNGTQQIFEASDKVYFYSLHQFPLYPGTGAATETGVGPGQGYTRNRPLSAGCDDDDYLKLIAADLDEIGKSFQPELILISAGFDAHARDPLGGMRVTDAGFGRMTRLVADLADSCCQGRVLSLLEGGYDLEGLAGSVARHVATLAE